MLYNINTATEIDMLNRVEKALQASRTEGGRAFRTSSANSKPIAPRAGHAIWAVLVQLFGAPTLF